MEITDSFLGTWNQAMFYGILTSLALGVLTLVIYEFNVLRIKDYKLKYDYVNLHEIRYFWYALIFFLLAAGFAINTIGSETLKEMGVRWFCVRIFFSLSLMVVAYFAANSLLNILYPKKIARRLHKLRTAPRVSPDGNRMRRLTEEEEDIHMERSMIAEEEVQVVDYDVWLDEKTGFKKIEKYVIHDKSVECPECGFYTLMINSEEVVKNPTETESGVIIEHLECKYCSHKQRREISVSSFSANVV